MSGGTGFYLWDLRVQTRIFRSDRAGLESNLSDFSSVAYVIKRVGQSRCLVDLIFWANSFLVIVPLPVIMCGIFYVIF